VGRLAVEDDEAPVPRDRVGEGVAERGVSGARDHPDALELVRAGLTISDEHLIEAAGEARRRRSEVLGGAGECEEAAVHRERAGGRGGVRVWIAAGGDA